MKRKAWRLVGDRKQHLTALFTIVSLVLIVGLTMLATTITAMSMASGPESESSQVVKAALIALGPLVVLTILVVMLYNQQISGPIHRLEIELERMKNGDFSTPTKLRRKDHFQRVAQLLDEVRAQVHERLEKDRQNP